MSKHKDAFEFDKVLDSGELIYHALGRLHLAGGHIVRLYLAPDGLKIMVPHEAIGKGVIVGKEWKDGEVTGLPYRE
jgi:hypothetical protein